VVCLDTLTRREGPHVFSVSCRHTLPHQVPREKDRLVKLLQSCVVWSQYNTPPCSGNEKAVAAATFTVQESVMQDEIAARGKCVLTPVGNLH
jgi:hypothetical protein